MRRRRKFGIAIPYSGVRSSAVSSANPFFPEELLRRLLLIILLLMAASVLSILWVKNFVDRTRPPAVHVSSLEMEDQRNPGAIHHTVMNGCSDNAS